MTKKDKKNDDDIRLSDESIAQIAKILQMALLTGTDIVDNLRLMRLTLKDGVLVPDERYTETFNENIQNMIEKTPQKQGLTPAFDKN